MVVLMDDGPTNGHAGTWDALSAWRFCGEARLAA
jgi:hypothetical protein